MKEKNLFLMGAVALMILVAFVPAINGMQLKAMEENESDSNSETFEDFDLNIKVTSCEYDRLADDEVNVIYNVEYEITNFGEGTYPGGEIECQMDMGEISREWSISVDELVPGAYSIGEKEVSLSASVEDEEDEEKYLAGEIFSLNIEPGDATTSIGHFGWEGEDYYPTVAQIKKTMKQMAENVGGEDGRDGIFGSLKDRLGWVYDLGVHLETVGGRFYIFLAQAIKWGADILEEMAIIEDWLNEWVDFLNNPNWESLERSLQKIPDVIKALNDIQEKLIDPPPELIEAWENFVEAINQFEEWLNEKHWENPIDMVSGALLDTGSKAVHVHCREQENDFSRYYLFDDLSPTWDGEEPWQMHDCTIRFSGSVHAKKSPYVLSWAFSEGKFTYDAFLVPIPRTRIFEIFQWENSLLMKLLERFLNLIQPLSLS